MRRLLPLFAVLVLATGCPKENPAPPQDKTPTPASGAVKAGAANGTDGGGNGTGSNIANARALRKGTASTFDLDCKTTVYTGPFRFAKDPEKLVIAGRVKTTGPQICIGGEWVDSSGKAIGPSGLGCAEPIAEGKPEIEYSPGNGGNSTNPVYLALKFGEPKPAGCPSVEITLSLP